MSTSRGQQQSHLHPVTRRLHHSSNPQSTAITTATAAAAIGSSTAGASSLSYHQHSHAPQASSSSSLTITTGPEITAVPYETMDRRHSAVVNLESWELLAMHSIASDESIPRVRLRLLKSLAGLPTEDAHSGGSHAGVAIASPSGSSAAGKKRGGMGAGVAGGSGGGNAQAIGGRVRG